MNLIKRAIEEPLRQIVSNCGVDASIVIDKVRNSKGANGFNAQTEKYVDLIKDGVIDPTKVVRTSLQNAASVASLMLTTDCMVAEKAQEGRWSCYACSAWRHGRHGLLRSPVIALKSYLERPRIAGAFFYEDRG